MSTDYAGIETILYRTAGQELYALIGLLVSGINGDHDGRLPVRYTAYHMLKAFARLGWSDSVCSFYK